MAMGEQGPRERAVGLVAEAVAQRVAQGAVFDTETLAAAGVDALLDRLDILVAAAMERMTALARDAGLLPDEGEPEQDGRGGGRVSYSAQQGRSFSTSGPGWDPLMARSDAQRFVMAAEAVEAALKATDGLVPVEERRALREMVEGFHRRSRGASTGPRTRLSRLEELEGAARELLERSTHVSSHSTRARFSKAAAHAAADRQAEEARVLP